VHRQLVGALLSWVDMPLRGRTNKFLRGLALDELRFLAGFCGLCVLESDGETGGFRTELAARIACYRTSVEPSDRDLKMILLVEYLNRAGLQPAPLRALHD
jgi:hypothetical protein